MNPTKTISKDNTPTPSNHDQIETKNDSAEIGASIKVIGDISGKENLIINGNVEGTVDFRENDVTVGKSGKVNANINAKNLIVYGEVKGELRGREQVTIKSTGRVNGDIRAPRVALDDGCQFKGAVDMEEKATNQSNSPTVTGSNEARLSSPNLSPNLRPPTSNKLFGGPIRRK